MTRGVKPGLPKLSCFLCSNAFQAKTSWQKFCSRTCEQGQLQKVNPARKRASYKRWLENKKKNDPGYFRQLYLRRKENEPNYRKKASRHGRNFHRKSRLKVLEYYGSRCKCCGESRNEFLCVDHLNGGGSKHRKELRGKSSIFRYIIRNNYPKEFRVLCHNCNQSLGYYGYCPHKKL